ncbi:MAG TPA: spore coat U domain-containing protein [Casimicrobiaceae bacterium]|nr:spore coat U domain-containing protein [Casimicrobiaceae bacterium]
MRHLFTWRQPAPAPALRIVALGLALALGSTAQDARAATCTVSTPGVAFGSYDVFAAGATTGNGTITVACTFDLNIDNGLTRVNYTVSLSTGGSNSFVQRLMASGANTLGYNLYTSNAFAQVWGDGTGSTATVSGSLSVNPAHTSASNSHTVYGRVPALQDAAVASNYRDNVTVTVNY